MQIINGLYQIGGSLNGLTWTNTYRNYDDANTYLIKNGDESILIDCGNGDTWAQIEENMHRWNISPKSIKGCFLTHAHIDHTGAAHILKNMNIPLYAQKETAFALEAADERCGGYLYHKKAEKCEVDIAFDGGESFNICGIEIKTLHCPGHTAGCTAYFFEIDNKRIVACGDIIGTLMDGHFGWAGSIDFDRKSYLESLKKFALYDSDIMLSGHGLIYFGKPRQRVEEALCVALSEWR